MANSHIFFKNVKKKLIYSIRRLALAPPPSPPPCPEARGIVAHLLGCPDRLFLFHFPPRQCQRFMADSEAFFAVEHEDQMCATLRCRRQVIVEEDVVNKMSTRRHLNTAHYMFIFKYYNQLLDWQDIQRRPRTVRDTLSSWRRRRRRSWLLPSRRMRQEGGRGGEGGGGGGGGTGGSGKEGGGGGGGKARVSPVSRDEPP